MGSAAADEGVMSGELESRLDEHLRQLIGPRSGAHVATRVRQDNLPYVLQNGVSNVYQWMAPGEATVSRPRGQGYFDARREAEQKAFGGHPVYGYLATPDEHLTENHARAFGDAKIIFQPHVRENTTFVYGDSMQWGLGEEYGPVPTQIHFPSHLSVPKQLRDDALRVQHLHVNIGDERYPEPPLPPDLQTLRRRAQFAVERGHEGAEDLVSHFNSVYRGWLDGEETAGRWQEWPFSDFFEAQIHQPYLGPEDIAAITSPHAPSEEVKALLRKHHIPYLRFDHDPHPWLWESEHELPYLERHASRGQWSDMTMYHVSPVRNRDSIMREGLRLWNGPSPYLWLVNDHPVAQQIAHLQWSGSRDNDVWAVDVSDHNVQPDPHPGNPAYKANSYIVDEPVPPHKVRLLSARMSAETGSRLPENA